jgi:hypothetical protein
MSAQLRIAGVVEIQVADADVGAVEQDELDGVRHPEVEAALDDALLEPFRPRSVAVGDSA